MKNYLIDSYINYTIYVLILFKFNYIPYKIDKKKFLYLLTIK